MDVSIITPFYKGNKYLKQYINNMYQVLDTTDRKYKFEIIIVNDSPEVDIDISEEDKKKLNIKIIVNNKNYGIHLSRINGYNNSCGKYIIFLDQDDEVSSDIINVFLSEIGENDLCVSNGFFEFDNNKYQIFKDYKSGKYSIKEKKYIYIRDFIASPGQCLIKKDSVPKKWIENPLEINGTDDYFLWLLMFDNNCKMKYIHKELYTHKDTGNNLSLDIEKMYNSTLCLLNKLNKVEYNPKKLKQLSKKEKYTRLFCTLIYFYIM